MGCGLAIAGRDAEAPEMAVAPERVPKTSKTTPGLAKRKIRYELPRSTGLYLFEANSCGSKTATLRYT